MGAQVSRVKLQHCGFDTSAPSGLSIPGCKALPDAVLVRTMDAGSFEHSPEARRVYVLPYGIDRGECDRGLLSKELGQSAGGGVLGSRLTSGS